MVLVRFQHQPLPRQLTPMHTHTAVAGSAAQSNRFHVLPLVVVSQRQQQRSRHLTRTHGTLRAMLCCCRTYTRQRQRGKATAAARRRRRAGAARNRSAELVPSRIRTLFVVGRCRCCRR